MQALEAAAGAESTEQKAEGDDAEEAKSGAAKADPEKATRGSDSDSDVVCVDDEDGDTAHSGYSGFYRASRETGRSNVLLALQVKTFLILFCYRRPGFASSDSWSV